MAKKTIKDKIRYWLNRDETLKDSDLRLTANIWHSELIEQGAKVEDFLKLYSIGKMSQAPSIKRDRAFLQATEPELRGKMYEKRKDELEKQHREKYRR